MKAEAEVEAGLGCVLGDAYCLHGKAATSALRANECTGLDVSRACALTD